MISAVNDMMAGVGWAVTGVTVASLLLGRRARRERRALRRLQAPRDQGEA